MKGKDYTGIYYLKVVLSIMIVVLHYAGGCGNVLQYSEGNMFNKLFVMSIQSLSIGAVDAFIMVSGFLTCKKSSCLHRVAKLITTTLILNSVLNVITILIANSSFTLPAVFNCFFPRFWFFWVFLAVLLLANYLSIVINHLSSRSRSMFILTVFCLLILYPYTVDFINSNYGTDLFSTLGIAAGAHGYSLTNAVACWLIGAWIRTNEIQLKRIASIAGFITSTIIIFIFYLFFFNSLDYNNPIVVAQASFLLIFFARFEPRNSNLVKFLSSKTYEIFIIHVSIPFIWGSFIKQEFIANLSLPLLMIYSTVFIGAIWILSFLISLIFSPLITRVTEWLLQKFKQIWITKSLTNQH